MLNFKPMILGALTLFVFAGGASPVVANRTGPFLVAIHHKGQVIEVSPLAFESPGHACLIGLTANSIPIPWPALPDSVKMAVLLMFGCELCPDGQFPPC